VSKALKNLKQKYDIWAAMTKSKNANFSLSSWLPFLHSFLTQFSQVLTSFLIHNVKAPFLDWRCLQGC